MRLRYTLPALADLDDILGYITAHSPPGAIRVQARIKAITDLLLHYPRIGTDDPTIRRISTSPYPYLIFYEATDTEIVAHARAPRRAQSKGNAGFGLIELPPSTNAGLPTGGGCR